MSDDSEEFSQEELVGAIADFITANMDVSSVFRSHLVETLVSRVYDEFGDEGLCDMMLKIDERANWVSDILIDGPELDDQMFKRHQAYDHDVLDKARGTQAMMEFNKKIFRLRTKYCRLIVDEIVQTERSAPSDPGLQ